MRAVIMSTSWLILLFTKAALIGLTSENELLASPMIEMVVFNTERPVRCEAVFKSNADGATPAGRGGRRQFCTGNRAQDAEAVARHRRAALYVQQGYIQGVANLAGEEANAIGAN